MSITIKGVPQAIEHSAYLDFLRGVGFELERVVDLSFERSGIKATVTMEPVLGHVDGESVDAGDPRLWDTITHELFIPFVETVKS